MTDRNQYPDNSLARLVLGQCGLSPGERQQALPAALRGLHQVILQEFTVRGQVPARTELASIAARLGLDAGEALAHLVTSDLLVLSGIGEIAVAYPYSAIPTGHQVEIMGGPAVSAMCAIDALGIPAMTGHDAAITAADPATGEHVHVDVRGGHAQARPAGAAVSLPAIHDGPAARCRCPLINFHASPQAAQRFLTSAGLPGAVLSLPEAAEAGSRLFSCLLRPDP